MTVNGIAPIGAEATPELDVAGAARRLENAAPEDVQKAAKEFEAVFLNQFVGTMFEGMETDGMFGGGPGEKMWQGFLVQHISDSFAERGGIGIADMVIQQLTQDAEVPE